MGDVAPTIVDCDLLEAAKENVQPLASGRRVTSLSTVLSTPHAFRDARLSNQRVSLRYAVTRALEGSEEGDEEEENPSPLDAYHNFVSWTLEHYPQGHSAESGLLELLEEATRVLKDHDNGKYKNELKYLKLWILYASFVEKPIIVYKFLLANDIGVGWGSLYEEFALAFEREGRHKEADAIYRLGIARNATPLDKLRNRYRDFQKRMMSSSTVPPSDSPTPLPPPPPASTTTTKRTVLGTASLDTLSPPPTTTSPPTTHPRPNATIQVFQDAGPSSTVEIQTNAYPDLGTRKTRIKENVKEVGKMGGTIMKSKGASKRPPPGESGIVVYRDPEDEGAGPSTGRQASQSKLKPPAAVKGKPVAKAYSTSSIAVFKDEVPHAPSTTSKGKAKTKAAASAIFVFKDDEPKPASTNGKVPSGSGSGITVFRDEPETPPGTKTVPTSPTFTPFQDEQPATPGGTAAFEPFRDESDKGRSAGFGKVKGVMGLVLTSAEAEALRKDPLKNYPDGGGVGHEDGLLIGLDC